MTKKTKPKTITGQQHLKALMKMVKITTKEANAYLKRNASNLSQEQKDALAEEGLENIKIAQEEFDKINKSYKLRQKPKK